MSPHTKKGAKQTDRMPKLGVALLCVPQAVYGLHCAKHSTKAASSLKMLRMQAPICHTAVTSHCAPWDHTTQEHGSAAPWYKHSVMQKTCLCCTRPQHVKTVRVPNRHLQGWPPTRPRGPVCVLSVAGPVCCTQNRRKCQDQAKHTAQTASTMCVSSATRQGTRTPGGYGLLGSAPVLEPSLYSTTPQPPRPHRCMRVCVPVSQHRQQDTPGRNNIRARDALAATTTRAGIAAAPSKQQQTHTHARASNRPVRTATTAPPSALSACSWVVKHGCRGSHPPPSSSGPALRLQRPGDTHTDGVSRKASKLVAHTRQSTGLPPQPCQHGRPSSACLQSKPGAWAKRPRQLRCTQQRMLTAGMLTSSMQTVRHTQHARMSQNITAGQPLEGQKAWALKPQPP
jgi:hypothetical protein